MAVAPFRLPHHWPKPSDPAAAARFVERYAALGRHMARLAAQAVPLEMLQAIGGNSPYIADLAIREAETLRRFVREGPDTVFDEVRSAVMLLTPATSRVVLAASLREAKRRAALVIALADIGGLWDLDRVTAALTDLAETSLHATVTHLLAAGAAAGDLELPLPGLPEAGCGFVVLGMGKLGARELNYSSDIDLVLLQNPEAGVYVGETPGAFFTRMAHNLVALMDARDANGYVFRVDLRLRPDPAATPPCIALPAAITYYESMGQNWERAAMLKARPVAGDVEMGRAFLDAIRPFVWRRHVDFALVADIHAMKQRIDAHKGTGIGGSGPPEARILGHNVKLGAGGIREIEFIAQTLQLVWGGRDPDLRVRRTLEAIGLLVRAGRVPRRAATELAGAYRFLRSVEHRLQMVADRQTHTLPEKPDGLSAFATFMGFTSARAFALRLLRHLDRVQARWAELFDAVPSSCDVTGLPRLDFSGVGDPPPPTAAALAAMGYQSHEHIVDSVRAWQAGRIRALRSERARILLAEVLPALLHALSRQADPDAAFRRFDEFLTRLPAGVQLLSMFQRNPALMERVSAVLGAAPTLAGHLTNTPSALEGLLQPAEAPDVKRMLRNRLADARSLEDAIAIIRSTVRAEDFRISVATMEGRADADHAGLARADLADAALGALVPLVLADFAARNGRVNTGGLAVVVLGKTGSREMMAGSDLDLMFVYDHSERVTESDGTRRMAASQYFIRAVHAIVAAVTSPDAEGPMYAIDMRLRPSGNKGPVAVSLAGFERYHRDDAWTWERMSLTRARVIAGPPALRRRVGDAIRSAIGSAGPPALVRRDAAAMRTLMLRQLPPQGPWDVKARPGGQVEVEFIAQALQLIHPAFARPATREALAALRDGDALSVADAALLIRADRVWRTVQGILRIVAGRTPPEDLARAASDTLLKAAGAALGGERPVDLSTLRATLDALALDVRAIFQRIVGTIAA